jgi:hypothetical protein
MIGGPAAFCRFVRHDLRLSARGLMSMFGGVSPGRLGAIAAALFAALHGAAWPVAGSPRSKAARTAARGS